MPTPRPQGSRRVGWVAWLAALAAFAVLIGLGTWQMQRMAWKEGLLATIAERLAAPPVPLETALADPRGIAAQEYRRVTFSGILENAYERHFFTTFEGETGFNVYTPLKLDTGDYLFVNRGFVPYDRKEASSRPEGQLDGRVTVAGLLRPGLVEKPSAIVPDNDPLKNVFYWKDIRAMRETSGLPAGLPVLGFFVDADAQPNPGGLPRGGVTMIDLPNNHLGYAVTWYGLAAALAGVFAVLWWRGR